MVWFYGFVWSLLASAFGFAVCLCLCWCLLYFCCFLFPVFCMVFVAWFWVYLDLFVIGWF